MVSELSDNNIEPKLLKLSLSILMILSSLCLTACQRHTALVIENGVPLRFVLSGPGTLNHFVVSGPDLEREPHPQGNGERLMSSKIYWELAQSGSASRTLDDISVIAYGKIPAGFVQVQPLANLPPPPLVDTHLYNVTFTVNNDHGINSFFAIRDGKIVAEGQE